MGHLEFHNGTFVSLRPDVVWHSLERVPRLFPFFLFQPLFQCHIFLRRSLKLMVLLTLQCYFDYNGSPPSFYYFYYPFYLFTHWSLLFFFSP